MLALTHRISRDSPRARLFRTEPCRRPDLATPPPNSKATITLLLCLPRSRISPTTIAAFDDRDKAEEAQHARWPSSKLDPAHRLRRPMHASFAPRVVLVRCRAWRSCACGGRPRLRRVRRRDGRHRSSRSCRAPRRRRPSYACWGWCRPAGGPRARRWCVLAPSQPWRLSLRLVAAHSFAQAIVCRPDRSPSSSSRCRMRASLKIEIDVAKLLYRVFQMFSRQRAIDTVARPHLL